MCYKFKVIIPVLNGGKFWRRCVASVLQQNIPVDDVLVVDSGSNDGSLELSIAAGFEIIQIRKNDFNHGGTRQLCVEKVGDVDVVVFLTQDAILETNDSIVELLKAFDNNAVAAAYGRQLPHAGASVIATHARYYNYPEQSLLKGKDDIKKLGIKTAFISNSFSAYRVSILKQVGGFPSNTIFGEDSFTAAKMILDRYKVAYVASAAVYHSHDYTYMQEFKRYFDIGVFHFRESWMLRDLGKAEGEGKQYVISEIKFLLKNSPLLIPSMFIRTFLKYTGYRLGLYENKLPAWLKQRISMNRKYWLSGY